VLQAKIAAADLVGEAHAIENVPDVLGALLGVWEAAIRHDLGAVRVVHTTGPPGHHRACTREEALRSVSCMGRDSCSESSASARVRRHRRRHRRAEPSRVTPPPMSSMAWTPARVHRSAYEIHGCAAFTGSSRRLALSRPLFAPHSHSGWKRMVAPLLPPLPSFLKPECEEGSVSLRDTSAETRCLPVPHTNEGALTCRRYRPHARPGVQGEEHSFHHHDLLGPRGRVVGPRKRGNGGIVAQVKTRGRG
jgi:hypothetical protein